MHTNSTCLKLLPTPSSGWPELTDVRHPVLKLQVKDSQLSLEEGCALFSPPLTATELIWEKVSDTKLLMAWNSHTMVLAFRGTASMSNVFADIQVSSTTNPL